MQLDIRDTFDSFSMPKRNATIVIAVFALLSIITFAFIALRTIRNAMVLLPHHGKRPSRPPDILFFRTQLGQFTGCLILGNTFISIAGLINFSWLSRSGLSRGSLCSAQAVLTQVGLWVTCWFTAAHGIHTLCSLVFRMHQAHWCGVATVSIGWIIAFVAALAPMRKKNIYGPAGISCGILHSNPKELFFLGALPIILAAFISTAVYLVTYIVLHGKEDVNTTQKQGLRSTSRRAEDAPEEYRKFINKIVWTMFWFPLAFLLFLSPLCAVHILLFTGYKVPFASRVLADVCATILGLVNAGLLCNTFRVISPMSRAKLAAEAEASFASSESPMAPNYDFHPKPVILSHESSYRTFNSTQSSSNHKSSLNHSHSSSLSSVDSRTGLISAGKVPHKPISKPLGLHIIHPAELGRQLDSGPAPTSPHKNTKCQGTDTVYGVADSQLCTISLTPCPPRAVGLVGDSKPEPWTEDEKRAFGTMGDTGTFGKVREQSICSQASLSHLSVVPLDVTNKSAALATRLGIPVATTPSAMSSYTKQEEEDPGFPNKLVSRSETNLWNPDNADSRHFSNASYASTFSSDSGYTGEVVRAYKVRPLPQIPEPDDNYECEDGDAVGSLPSDLQRRSVWDRRMTRGSVWSQASGYDTKEEREETYWHTIPDLLDVSDDEASKRATFARPMTLKTAPKKRSH